MITTGESDSHLDGIDGGDLAAARVEVLLEVRQEDAKARKIFHLNEIDMIKKNLNIFLRKTSKTSEIFNMILFMKSIKCAEH